MQCKFKPIIICEGITSCHHESTKSYLPQLCRLEVMLITALSS